MCISVCLADPQDSPIPEAQVTALQNNISELNTQISATKKRRACKQIIRQGNSLLKDNPSASNRYYVLDIVFQSQRRLLTLDSSDRNREALFETCAKLAKAPDEYAKLRLKADLLLMERNMGLQKADIKVRTQALANLIQRYRDTPGEAKSLMMATLIAPKLEAFELEKQINEAMDERFAGDLDVIEWRRTHRNHAHFRLIFTGSFTRVDGTTLTFPIDGIGHTCLMFFWSEKAPEFEKQMLAMKKLQSQFPNQFKVFSFNLDELPDAGGNTLKRLDLDWTPMRLAGGKNSQIYRVYAGVDLIALRVNAHGHALLPSNLVRTEVDLMPMEQNLDEPRYLSQLQSLLIGDFLVNTTNTPNKSPQTAKSIPAEVLAKVQDCFTAAPLRYRLTPDQALANYMRAEKICSEAIVQYSGAPDLWHLRNYKIIALIGMWNLASEPKHLESASIEALTALTEKLPAGADVVPRFCLAKKALRLGKAKPTTVLESFIKDSGGDVTSASAYAAAAILAMDANMPKLHQQYREKLLATDSPDPDLWPVVTFLRDQNHRFRLFKANNYLPPSRARRVVRSALRSNVTDLNSSAEKSQLVKMDFKTLTGGKLSLPEATDDKLTLLIFVEPPTEPTADFPAEIKGSVTENTKGKKIETLGVMQHALQLADQDASKSIKVITAFLSDDTERVQALMKKNQWLNQAVMVPDGLANPMVQKLGIISADRVPNVFLLLPDGTVAWSLSGIVHPQHRSEGIGELMGTITRAMKANIEPRAMAQSLNTLKQGKFREAVQQFSGPLPVDPPAQDPWATPQLHGRALAYMGLKDWSNALSDIDAAILTHERIYNRRKPCSCHRVAKLLNTKASILEKLGRSDDAKKTQQRAAAATHTHTVGKTPSRYEVFHDQLDVIKPKQGK